MGIKFHIRFLQVRKYPIPNFVNPLHEFLVDFSRRLDNSVNMGIDLVFEFLVPLIVLDEPPPAILPQPPIILLQLDGSFELAGQLVFLVDEVHSRFDEHHIVDLERSRVHDPVLEGE
jgi:hypothetical protein